MRTRPLLLIILLSLCGQMAFAQNYLRILDPNAWGATATNQVGWHDIYDEGIFEAVDLVITPKGIYNQVEVFTTIGTDTWGWDLFLEAVWQFDLPSQAIVHDSWLWVNEDIIQADVVDFWTALATYEEIVDRQEDPSFLYIMPDNRYELRIYPIYEDFSRRVKLTILVPAEWSVTEVSSELLQNMFQSTTRYPNQLSISTPVESDFSIPRLVMDNEITTFTEMVTSTAGNVLYRLEVPFDEFVNADNINLTWDSPLSNEQRTFVSTYEHEGDQYYQLAHLPDWASFHNEDQTIDRSLLLLDYKSSTTNLSPEDMAQQISEQLTAHLGTADFVNAAVLTEDGLALLAEDWLAPTDINLEEALLDLVTTSDVNDVSRLLEEGAAWISNHETPTQLYLIANTDHYAYPPQADEVFAEISPNLPVDIPLTILNYQTQNVSIIYYNDETSVSNNYFYGLLMEAFVEAEMAQLHATLLTLPDLLSEHMPSLASNFPTGVVDYNISLANGLCYERHNISSSNYSADDNGVLLQTGKYLGQFPLLINGFLVTDDNDFYQQNYEVSEENTFAGDSLSNTIWKSRHLVERIGQIASEDDRYAVIDLSIAERILTPLTAFLALEPGQGGEPCIGCLYNDGELTVWTTEETELTPNQITVSPNPAQDLARITLTHTSALAAAELSAVIYNSNGQRIAVLDNPSREAEQTIWFWQINQALPAGTYYCQISNGSDEATVPLIVTK